MRTWAIILTAATIHLAFNGGHAASGDEAADSTVVQEFFNKQYQQLRQFHDKNRTRTEMVQREVTKQVAVPRVTYRTVQVPMTRQVCRWVRRGWHRVCVCSNVTTMTTRQEAVTSMVMESRTTTETVPVASVTSVAFTSDPNLTKRLTATIDLDSLPAAAGPEGDRMLAETKLASKLAVANENVLNDDVTLESGWFREGNLQMQVSIIASPLDGTPDNDIALQVLVQNAILGNTPPNQADLRPVDPAVVARGRTIGLAIISSFTTKKP